MRLGGGLTGWRQEHVEGKYFLTEKGNSLLEGFGFILKEDYYNVLHAIEQGEPIPNVYRKEAMLSWFQVNGYIGSTNQVLGRILQGD